MGKVIQWIKCLLGFHEAYTSGLVHFAPYWYEVGWCKHCNRNYSRCVK